MLWSDTKFIPKFSWPIKVHSEFWHASYRSVGSNSLRATRYFLNIESSTTIIEHITSTNWIHQRPFIPEAFVGHSMAECSALRSHEKPLKHQMKHRWSSYGNGLNSLFQACQPSSWTGAGRLWVGNWGRYGEMAVLESAIFSLWKTSWTYITWRWLEDFSHSNTVSVRRFYTFMWLILVCIHNTIRFQLLQRLRTRALVFISQQDEKIQLEVSGNDRLVDWGTSCVLIPKFMFLWVSCQFDVKTVKRLTVETWKCPFGLGVCPRRFASKNHRFRVLSSPSFFWGQPCKELWSQILDVCSHFWILLIISSDLVITCNSVDLCRKIVNL